MMMILIDDDDVDDVDDDDIGDDDFDGCMMNDG